MDFKWLLLSMKGRINRQSYIIASLIISALVFSSQKIIELKLGLVITIPAFLLMLFSFWPAISLTVKRLHDLDRSGWWALICLIPIANMIILLYATFIKGTEGANQFGSDPLPLKEAGGAA